MLTKKKKAVAISLIVLLAVVVLLTPLVVYMHTDAYMMSQFVITSDYEVSSYFSRNNARKRITISEAEKLTSAKREYIMSLKFDKDNNIKDYSDNLDDEIVNKLENGIIINSTITNSINNTLWALGNRIRITNDELIMLDSGRRCPITRNEIWAFDEDKGSPFINDGVRGHRVFDADVSELFKCDLGPYVDIIDADIYFKLYAYKDYDETFYHHALTNFSLSWTIVNRNNNTVHYVTLEIEYFDNL